MAQTSTQLFTKFKKTVWSYYRAHRREMPWRGDITPYRVVVSEMMLQQTQVSRITKKFESWMRRFPDWQTLSDAPIKDVLREWSGLGYNRRALYLKRIAEMIMADPARDLKAVMSARKLPGIGPNTAGAIRAFAFNEPVPFIETNIRSVFIHFFFSKKRGKVRDDEIMLLIRRALSDKTIKTHAREWYYALMDYGAHLKSRIAGTSNPSRKSVHHVRQKPFKGSNRELRSNILKSVMAGPAGEAALVRRFKEWPAKQTKENIGDLVREGFMVKRGSVYTIR